jgi:hypothetical protein
MSSIYELLESMRIEHGVLAKKILKVKQGTAEYAYIDAKLSLIHQHTTPIFDKIEEIKETEEKLRCKMRILGGSATDAEVFNCSEAASLFYSSTRFVELPIGELLHTGFGEGGKLTVCDVQDMLRDEEAQEESEEEQEEEEAQEECDCCEQEQEEEEEEDDEECDCDCCEQDCECCEQELN